MHLLHLACPYDAQNLMSKQNCGKCNFCIDRISDNRNRLAAACPVGALRWRQRRGRFKETLTQALLMQRISLNTTCTVSQRA